MAEGPADGTRKRSRSPSDSEQPKVHKRANTGPTSTQQQNDSNGLDGTSSARVPTVSPASLNDVAMPDALSSTTNDTAASTPTATAPVKPEMLANADTPGSPTSLTAGRLVLWRTPRTCGGHPHALPHRNPGRLHYHRQRRQARQRDS